MSERIRIGFDVDDVLCDFLGTFMKLAREMFGKPGRDVPLIHYEVENDLYHLTAKEAEAVWKVIYTTPSYYLTFPVIGTPQEMWQFSRDKNFLPYFVTARHARTVGEPIETQTAEWLDSRLGIRYPTVFVGRNKGELARALGLNYFIDNKPEMILDVWEKTDGRTKCYLFDRPHNQWFNDATFERVSSLTELYENVTMDWKMFGQREPVGGLIGR